MRIRYSMLRIISILLMISHCVSLPLQAGILPETLVYASTQIKPISSVNTQEHLFAHDVDGNIVSQNVSYMQRMVRHGIVQITCDY